MQQLPQKRRYVFVIIALLPEDAKRLRRFPQRSEEAKQGFIPCVAAGFGAAPHLERV